VSTDRQASACGFVVFGVFIGVEIGADKPFGWAGFFDFGDDGGLIGGVFGTDGGDKVAWWFGGTRLHFHVF